MKEIAVSYEYRVERVSDHHFYAGDSPTERLVRTLNALDAEGWEVVSVANYAEFLIIARRSPMNAPADVPRPTPSDKAEHPEHLHITP
jgi:hypothetical protein